MEQPFEYGNDFGSPDETWLSSQFDRPVMVHRYPAAVKAFYMEPDPAGPDVCALRRRARARRLRRSHRRLAARLQLRAAQRADRAARPAQGSLPVVPGPAPLRQRAARRDSAWASSGSSPGSAGSTTCVRPFRLRARCTGFIRDELRSRSNFEVRSGLGIVRRSSRKD